MSSLANRTRLLSCDMAVYFHKEMETLQRFLSIPPSQVSSQGVAGLCCWFGQRLKGLRSHSEFATQT